MRDELADKGLDITGMRVTAWALGVIAVGSLFRLFSYAGNDTPVQAELFAWVLIGALAGAFSAGCAVLAGVKSTEQRLLQRNGTSCT